MIHSLVPTKLLINSKMATFTTFSLKKKSVSKNNDHFYNICLFLHTGFESREKNNVEQKYFYWEVHFVSSFGFRHLIIKSK